MPPKTAIAKRRKFARIAALSYRIPLPVSKILLFASGDGYPICPRCDCTVDREYMHFCDRCGQRLGWQFCDFVNIVQAPRKKPKSFLYKIIVAFFRTDGFYYNTMLAAD